MGRGGLFLLHGRGPLLRPEIPAAVRLYDVPFYAYQDKIISFAVVAYACLFANAAWHRSGVPAAIVALGVTVLGLSAVNVSDALGSVLDGRSTLAYWIQTGLIAAYFALLLGLHAAGERAPQNPR